MADTGAMTEPHQLDDTAFYDEVQSFEFWFDSVEGYLSGRDYGHDPSIEPATLGEDETDRLITILSSYCVGETAALEGAAGLVRLAPNHSAKVFMATQVADEARHLEVFMHRLGELGVTDPEATIARRANPGLNDFRTKLLALIDDGDWAAAVFAQNVILETMEYTVFRAHAGTADPVTADVLRGVVSDERRHMGFGESDLGRRLSHEPSTRTRLREIKADLDPIVLNVFEAAFDDAGIPRERRPDLGREYLDTIERLALS
jgi:1,2-phenylacetyl-CoA epoxidase catalytic subunit